MAAVLKVRTQLVAFTLVTSNFCRLLFFNRVDAKREETPVSSFLYIIVHSQLSRDSDPWQVQEKLSLKVKVPGLETCVVLSIKKYVFPHFLEFGWSYPCRSPSILHNIVIFVY